jgi:hypothetical protein
MWEKKLQKGNTQLLIEKVVDIGIDTKFIISAGNKEPICVQKIKGNTQLLIEKVVNIGIQKDSK